MNFESKKVSIIFRAVTSVVLSRTMFYFFNDPEGPNLLIVMVTAGVVYFLSLAAYLFNFSGKKKLLLAILIQVVVVAGLYLCFSYVL